MEASTLLQLYNGRMIRLIFKNGQTWVGYLISVTDYNTKIDFERHSDYEPSDFSLPIHKSIEGVDLNDIDTIILLEDLED